MRAEISPIAELNIQERLAQGIVPMSDVDVWALCCVRNTMDYLLYNPW